MPAPSIDPRYQGPWPLVPDLVRAELSAYLTAAGRPEAARTPTRCEPWSVADITAHIAETARRFADLLERSREGDFTPPFAPAELSAENLRRVEGFRGDARADLLAQAERLLHLIVDGDEPIAHQFGPIPVSLQTLFLLNELAIHHDDVAVAFGGRYRPPDAVIAALLPVWDRALQLLDPERDGDPWDRIIEASGR